jgi:hypothetical protein
MEEGRRNGMEGKGRGAQYTCFLTVPIKEPNRTPQGDEEIAL